VKIFERLCENKMSKTENSSNHYIVEKSNSLNTLMCDDMGLTELRFFCLYLSKLNARNVNQRTVDISVKDFESFFDVQFNSTLFTKKIRKIMGRTVEIKEEGKIKVLTLYSEFCWSENKPNTITITCNDKMLPYIFELQKNYTTYTIENISKLNSVQKIRLYEVCKQYQKLGRIKIDLEELFKMLCCKSNHEFKDFRKNTLDPAVRDINENTDIILSYTKNLSCRRVVALTFDIQAKAKEIPIEPIPEHELTEAEVKAKQVTTAVCEESPLETLYMRCNKEYTLEQLFKLCEYVNSTKVRLNVSTENYIYSIYCKIDIEGKKVKNLYRYTFTIIEKQMQEHMFGDVKQSKSSNRKETSYDLEKFCREVEVREV
jgi:plasmid replication initiation protein